MNDEQKKWYNQASASFGPNEFLRFGCAYMGWMIAGLILGFKFNIGITIIFIGIAHVILWFAPYWKPAFTLARRLMGNNNIPPELPKVKYTGWGFIVHYLVLGIKLSILFATFYLGIRLLITK